MMTHAEPDGGEGHSLNVPDVLVALLLLLPCGLACGFGSVMPEVRRLEQEALQFCQGRIDYHGSYFRAVAVTVESVRSSYSSLVQQHSIQQAAEYKVSTRVQTERYRHMAKNYEARTEHMRRLIKTVKG